MLKLFNKTKKTNLNQIPQQYETLFAFGAIQDGVLVQLSQFVLCRDFLNDTLVWSKDPKAEKRAIYGWKYYGPIDLTNTTFLLKFTGDSVSKDVFVKNLPLLNELEVKLGLTPTVFLETSVVDIIYTIGDPKWMVNTIPYSIYHQLLRILGAHTFTSFEDLYSLCSDGPCRTLRDAGVFSLANYYLNLNYKGIVSGAGRAVWDNDGNVKEIVPAVGVENQHHYNGFVTAVYQKYNTLFLYKVKE